MDLVIAVVLAGALLAALFLLLGRIAEGRRSEDLGRVAAAPGGEKVGAPDHRVCPLCFTSLSRGERVASKLYPGEAGRIMRIYGCPHCWPATPSVPRICPVCGQALDARGWVTARYFERPGRGHVHVLGCTGCRDK